MGGKRLVLYLYIITLQNSKLIIWNNIGQAYLKDEELK